MFKAIIVFTVLAIILISCEGAIYREGHVYDKITRQPVEHVEAIMILGKNDTVKLRGAEDGVYTRSFSNDTGYFSVSSGLIGAMPRYPECRVLLVKKSYLPLEIRSKYDSIFIEKEIK